MQHADAVAAIQRRINEQIGHNQGPALEPAQPRQSHDDIIAAAIRRQMQQTPTQREQRTPTEARDIRQKQGDVFGIPARTSQASSGEDIDLTKAPRPGAKPFAEMTKEEQEAAIRNLNKSRGDVRVAGVEEEQREQEAFDRHIGGHSKKVARRRARDATARTARAMGTRKQDYSDQVNALQSGRRGTARTGAPRPEGESLSGMQFQGAARNPDQTHLADMKKDIDNLYDSIAANPRFAGKVDHAHRTMTMLLKRYNFDKDFPPNTLRHSDDVDKRMTEIAVKTARVNKETGKIEPRDKEGNPTDNAWAEHLKERGINFTEADIAAVKDHAKRWLNNVLTKRSGEAPEIPHKRAVYVPLKQAPIVPKEQLAMGQSPLEVAQRKGETPSMAVTPTISVMARTHMAQQLGEPTKDPRGQVPFLPAIGGTPSPKETAKGGRPLRMEMVRGKTGGDVPTKARTPYSHHGYTRGSPGGVVMTPTGVHIMPAQPSWPTPGSEPKEYELPKQEPTPQVQKRKRPPDFNPSTLQPGLSVPVPAKGKGLSKQKIKEVTGLRVDHTQGESLDPIIQKIVRHSILPQENLDERYTKQAA